MGPRVCCTIIESWFVIAWRWGPPLPRLQANGSPCRAGELVRGPFLGGRLLSSKQPTASGTDQGPTHLGTAECKLAGCRLRAGLQACGIQGQARFPSPRDPPS